MKLYLVHNEDYCWQAVVRANDYKEAINKFHEWADEIGWNKDSECWNSRNIKWYADLCDNDKVIE